MDFAPGTIVAGRYRIERKVGQGAWGEVWSADHITVGLKVALKTLRPTATGDAEAVARFRRESYFLGRIKSDHVARVFDFFSDDRYGLVLVMDYIEGEPLSRVLKSPLSIEDAIDLGCDLAAGVRDLHAAGIIHRDLKPANVIMQPLPGGGQRAMIVDFSLSRLAAGAQPGEISLTDLTKSHMALGTLPYMAPEQVLNSRQVTEQSDLYAIGAILFRGIVGRHIFEETEGELAKKKLTVDPQPAQFTRTDAVARGLARIVDRSLKRRPAERYKTATQMLDDFRELREAARAPVEERAPRPEEHDTYRISTRATSSKIAIAAPPEEEEDDELETRQRRAPTGSSSSRAARSNAPRIMLVVFSGLSLLFLGIVAGSILTEHRLGAAALAAAAATPSAPSSAPDADVADSAPPAEDASAIPPDAIPPEEMYDTPAITVFEDAAAGVVSRRHVVRPSAPKDAAKDAAATFPTRLPSSSDEPAMSEGDAGAAP